MHEYDFHNQEGAVLVTTIVVLLLLTIIGVAGINTTNTDLEITSKYRDANQQFYQSDAHLNLMVANATNSWLNSTSALLTDPDPVYSFGYDFDSDGKDETITTVTGLTENSTDDLPNVKFNSPNSTIGKGFSIKSDKSGRNGSSIRSYAVITNHTESSTQVEVGYFKKFH